MPDEPSSEEQALVSKANIAKVKTGAMKKGLAREKNQILAKKKDLLAKQMTPPEELTRFLRSDATFEAILRVAHADAKDILVRRYACTYILVFHTQVQGSSQFLNAFLADS